MIRRVILNRHYHRLFRLESYSILTFEYEHLVMALGRYYRFSELESQNIAILLTPLQILIALVVPNFVAGHQPAEVEKVCETFYQSFIVYTQLVPCLSFLQIACGSVYIYMTSTSILNYILLHYIYIISVFILLVLSPGYFPKIFAVYWESNILKSQQNINPLSSIDFISRTVYSI